MDLAKDILDVAEKVGTAPGLTIASSIVTNILKTVETSKNNTVRLRTLAHSLASQLIEISENMKGKWDDAPLTLKRAVDEYDAFLLEMIKSITRLSQYSRLRAFFLAGECEREITRLERRVADVRSTVMMMIGISISVAVNQVQTSLASYGHFGLEVHSSVQRLVDDAQFLYSQPESHQTTPEFSILTREDFQVTKTISRQATHDQQHRDVMTVTIHQAERCSNGRAILIKTFEGNNPWRVRSQFKEELDMNRKALNTALLQIIGWSNAAAQIPFHAYHSPGGIIEPFFSWAERTVRSRPVETIFGLYDMRHSIKELLEFRQSQPLFFELWFYEAVVNIQQDGGRPRFSLIYAGTIFQRDLSHKVYASPDYNEYKRLSSPDFWTSYCSIPNTLPAANLVSLFAGGAKDWFRDVHGIEALFKGSYDTIDLLQLGPLLLKAGWLSKSFMYLKSQGSMRLGDVGYLAQDGHFEVVANLHTTLVSRTGGLPAWTYSSSRFDEPQHQNEYEAVTHAGESYRCYQHAIPAMQYKFSITYQHRVEYTDLDEGLAWETLQGEAFRIIEDNHLSVAPHELQLLISITDMFAFCVVPKDNSTRMVEPIRQQNFPLAPTTIAVYEFQQDGSLSDSGIPELNARVFYSFQENIAGLDPPEIQQHPETGDILMAQYLKRPCKIEYLQLPLGVTRPSGIEKIIG